MLQPSRPTPPRHPCPAEPDQAAATPSPAGDATVHTRLVNGRPAPRLAPPIGQCLGDFEVLAELGRGGMGVVYKARQKGLDRLVALKLLPRELLHDSVRAARFQREARAVAALSHPNIVSIYQLGLCDAGLFQALEYIDGPSLDRVARQSRPPLAWVVAVMTVVAEAVHYAHTRGVLHRDLKPANVLLAGGRRPVIIDFGLAKFLTADTGLTLEGTILGSPSFMAPEQASKDNEPVGPAADVYSLGAVLYMLLTGRPPYERGPSSAPC